MSLSCAIHLQRTDVLVLCYSFAKDCCPCLVLFICKGLLSLSCAIHLQRTAVLDFCYCSQRTVTLAYRFQLQRIAVLDSACLSTAMHLQRTASLFHLKFTKDCSPCFLLFACKGLLSMFFAFCLQLIAVVVSC